MNKKALVLLMAAISISVMGCSTSKTVTRTESHTDENGNTVTTTTTTVEDSNGTTTTTETTNSNEAAEEDEFIVATIAFENETGVDIAELYFAPGSDDQWGEEILGEYAPLADGEVLTINDALTYSVKDGLYWDLKAADREGNTIEFEGLDMSYAANAEDITIVLEYDENEEDYTATVQ